MTGGSIPQLINDVDELLTDSTHPLDEKQARRMTLMMLRQIMNVQFEIQREIADWKADVKNRRDEVNERLTKIEGDVKAIKDLQQEYPSVTWLLRHRTSKALMAIAVALYLFFSNYPLVAALFKLPPLP